MHRNFKPGQKLRVNEETIGDDCFGIERIYPAGATAVVDTVDDDGVTIVIEGEIVNVFEGDECKALEIIA